MKKKTDEVKINAVLFENPKGFKVIKISRMELKYYLGEVSDYCCKCNGDCEMGYLFVFNLTWVCQDCYIEMSKRLEKTEEDKLNEAKNLHYLAGVLGFEED